MNRKELAEKVEDYMLRTIDYEVLYDEGGSKIFIGDYVRLLCDGVKDIIEGKE